MINGQHAAGCQIWRAGFCTCEEEQADNAGATFPHDSDCATHNEPAMANGPCDCSLSVEGNKISSRTAYTPYGIKMLEDALLRRDEQIGELQKRISGEIINEKNLSKEIAILKAENARLKAVEKLNYVPGLLGISRPLSENLIAFNDGSYKKIKFESWKHSQWIHYIRPNGKAVRINPANVNYIEEV